jgi:hypothetical protein
MIRQPSGAVDAALSQSASSRTAEFRIARSILERRSTGGYRSKRTSARSRRAPIIRMPVSSAVGPRLPVDAQRLHVVRGVMTQQGREISLGEERRPRRARSAAGLFAGAKCVPLAVKPGSIWRTCLNRTQSIGEVERDWESDRTCVVERSQTQRGWSTPAAGATSCVQSSEFGCGDGQLDGQLGARCGLPSSARRPASSRTSRVRQVVDRSSGSLNGVPSPALAPLPAVGVPVSHA